MLKIPVADDEVLYRRVPRVEGLYIIQAGAIIKVSSAAFSDRSFRPSVNRAELCHNDPGETQRDPSDGVVSVVTGDVRSIDTVVRNDVKGNLIAEFVLEVRVLCSSCQPPTLKEVVAIQEWPLCSDRKTFSTFANCAVS